MLHDKYPRPSLAEYSGGFYQEISLSRNVPAMIPALASQQEYFLKGSAGEVKLFGVELLPAPIAKVKIYFGDAVRPAVAWTEASADALMGVAWGCPRLHFLEQGDDGVSDAVIEKYLVSSEEYGSLFARSEEVLITSSSEGESNKIHFRKPMAHLTWAGPERYHARDEEGIIKAIARGLCTSSFGCRFSRVNWEIRTSRGEALAGGEAYLRVGDEGIVLDRYQSEDEFLAAFRELPPMLQELYDMAIAKPEEPDLEYTSFDSGSQPWKEASGYAGNVQWSVKAYLDLGRIAQKEVSAWYS